MTNDFDFVTSRCIACGAPSQITGGHVHATIWHILAGWCKEHQDHSNRPGQSWIIPYNRDRDGEKECNAEPGCYGMWQPRHGLRVRIESGRYPKRIKEIDIE